MPQTKEQRRYWALKRKVDKSIPDLKPKRRAEPVLLATSIKEYDELHRDHPDMKVALEPGLLAQVPLFDTEGFKDV